MAIPNNVRSFWSRFEKTTKNDVSSRFYEAFHFHSNEVDANALAELVMLVQPSA